MADFHLKIAGHTATVTSLFESTPQYLKAYLTEEEPEFSITVTRENIAFEQADLLEEAHRDGFKPRVFTDPFLERAAIQRAFAEFLFLHNQLYETLPVPNIYRNNLTCRFQKYCKLNKPLFRCMNLFHVELLLLPEADNFYQ